MFGGYTKEIIAAVIGLAVVPAAYAAGAYAKSHTGDYTVPGHASADPCPGESGATSACWTAYYDAFLERYPAVDALRDLKARHDAGGGAKTFCHVALHQIGAAAGEEYGSVAEAYKHGETFCRAGYYHGVLEGLFGDDGGEKLLTQLDSICADMRKDGYSYDYFSCVHGIGHGLMAFSNHDVFDSIAGCEKLSGEWEQSTCSGGVFMQNVIGNTPEEPSRFLTAADPLYPCTAVPEKFKTQCYLMQTSYMLTVFEGDFEATFAECRKAGAYAPTCFQSIGRDASGWSYGSVDSAVSLCSLGASDDERKNCLIGAAADFVQSYGEETARALCAHGFEGARVPCIENVEWHVSTMR